MLKNAFLASFDASRAAPVRVRLRFNQALTVLDSRRDILLSHHQAVFHQPDSSCIPSVSGIRSVPALARSHPSDARRDKTQRPD